jgi:tetratricopeptide (TPR) repeat protein
VTLAARFVVPAVAAAVLAAGSAAAQTPPPPAQGSATDNRALAEMLFFTARGMMEAGRYPEACAKLTESYRLDPAAGTLLNLAVCDQKQGKIASAWGEFRQSIAEARKANRPDREQLATDALAAVEPELPFLTITVPDAVRKVPGLVISRNGVPLNAAAWNTELPVDPGDVEIEETARDYKPKNLTIKIVNKQHATLSAEPLELAPIFRPPPPFWTTQRTVGAILFGAGVLAAGAGSYFGVVAINDKKNSDAACPNDLAGQQRCTQSGVDNMNNASTAAWISDVSLGVAGAAALVGAYLFITGGQKEEASPTPSAADGSWSVRVGAGPRGATGLLTKSF